jgi:tetratricopeptide (TPR) repeat protein
MTTTTTETARERGNALFKSGSYEDAIAAYDEAIASASQGNDNQSEAKARANKAACLINLNRDAMGEIARAVDLDGTYARARERMEAMVVARGSFESAIDALDETSALRVRLKKLADARARGNEKFKAGDREGAKEAYGEGLAGDGGRRGPGMGGGGRGRRPPGRRFCFVIGRRVRARRGRTKKRWPTRMKR